MKPKITIILCLAVTLITCCKKDDDDCIDPKNPKCSNYDPCYNVQEVSADFRIMEIVSSGNWYDTMMYETDTVFTLNLVQFEPKQERYDSVTWLIGSETLHEHSVARKSFPVYKTVPITLIVYRKPNTSCFPDDDGRDTVTKMITGMSYDDLPIRGKYQGNDLDNLEEVFTISVHDTMVCTNHDIRKGLLKNIPNGIPPFYNFPCATPFAAAYGGKAFFIPELNDYQDSFDNDPTNYCGMRCRGILDQGTLTIRYEYDEVALANAKNGIKEHEQAVYVQKIFKGKKL